MVGSSNKACRVLYPPLKMIVLCWRTIPDDPPNLSRLAHPLPAVSAEYLSWPVDTQLEL